MPPGAITFNLSAQYRRGRSSTPEAGRLARTSGVPRFLPHGANTDGCTSAIPRLKAARGRIPLIYAPSIDVVCRTGRIPLGTRRAVSRTGPYLASLRAQYRRCISSTPETGSLACTSIVPPCGQHGAYTDGCTSVVPLFGSHGAYTDGCTSGVPRFLPHGTYTDGCTSGVPRFLPHGAYTDGCTSGVPRCLPHGAYTDGCTSAIPRLKAARGRIPLIYAPSIDVVCHRRPRQDI